MGNADKQDIQPDLAAWPEYVHKIEQPITLLLPTLPLNQMHDLYLTNYKTVSIRTHNILLPIATDLIVGLSVISGSSSSVSGFTLKVLSLPAEVLLPAELLLPLSLPASLLFWGSGG